MANPINRGSECLLTADSDGQIRAYFLGTRVVENLISNGLLIHRTVDYLGHQIDWPVLTPEGRALAEKIKSSI